MHHNPANWPGWPKDRTAIIAEIGMNHGGDEDLAWEMIRSAHENGADFVKLQSYTTEELLHPSLAYFDGTKRMQLSMDAGKRLFKKAVEEGIQLITTPYDFVTVDMVDAFEPAAYKIASMDNDNIPLIRYVAGKRRPILIATGMADMDEIQKVLDTIKQTGNNNVVLLHCVSDYPAQPEDLNLSMIPFMRERFQVPVGISDHSLGTWSSFIAASLGAVIIEKHYTTDKDLLEKIPDADHDISITPGELSELRMFCEGLPVMMGRAPRQLNDNESLGRTTLRRGLYARRDIEAGETLSLENIVLLRPVQGVRAGLWDEVNGKRTKNKILRLQPVLLSDLEC